MIFLSVFLVSFGLALVFTPLVRFFAARIGVHDIPSPPLKTHQSRTSLLGGVAVFLAFTGTLWFLHNQTGFKVETSFIIFGIVGALLLLVIGGVLDDRYNLPPALQLAGPISATLFVIAAGVGQDNITNPLYFLGLSSDPLLHLNVRTINVFGLELTLFTDFFTFAWLMTLMYATKLLDGLNGLVSGITVIGSVILFFTSSALNQPIPAFLALIVAGSYLGFLPYNFVGKIFLGESGSTVAGFLLGVLSLLGPAKISITLLVLGLPILDLLWVMYERKFRAKTSPFAGDARHLHFKLVRSGLSLRRAVVLLWGISLVFGALGLVLQGIAEGALLFSLIALMGILLFITRRKTTLVSQ